MRNKYLLLLLFLILIGCSKNDKNAFIDNDHYRNISDYYFPKNSFSDSDDLDAFVQTWYGEHLDVLDNENLIFLNKGLFKRFLNKSKINVIRFTCLRTFHSPFSIKVIWDNNAKLIYNMSNGAGGYSAGELINHFEKSLNNDQINNLTEIIHSYNIFNQPSVIDESGFDGSQWIIEINMDGNYKVIDRWSPKRGMIYDIGKYLVELSGEEIYLY
ncbi:MAG: hypothetical protein LBI28_12485 [Treponema sp.]|jgi:hypothetical protein|nr:hypothetical protein [Treponema sp.]